MGRWLAAGIVILTIIIISSGIMRWNHQTNNVDVSESREELPEIEEELKQASTDIEKTQGRALDDVIAPFDERFQEMINRYEKTMKDYASKAEKTYYNNINNVSHREVVDTYKENADELEEEIDTEFHEWLEQLEKELQEEGYDSSYTLEYKWKYDTVRENTRMKYVKNVIALDSFSQ